MRVKRRSSSQIYDSNESAYYTIDNTEDIYGTTLSPAQRCYVDPWDLENYDYVRKKIDPTPSPSSYYSMSSSPEYTKKRHSKTARHFDMMSSPCSPYEMSAPCELQCCASNPYGALSPYSAQIYDAYYPHKFTASDELDTGYIHGYEGISSSSSLNDPQSLTDDEPQIHFEFPAPISHPPYEYCDPYASIGGRPNTDCCDCSSFTYGGYVGKSALYDSPDRYAAYDSLNQFSTSTIYGGNYGGVGYTQKFGLSKKGLLQIDYSCSWNDLDRAIGGNYVS